MAAVSNGELKLNATTRTGWGAGAGLARPVGRQRARRPARAAGAAGAAGPPLARESGPPTSIPKHDESQTQQNATWERRGGSRGVFGEGSFEGQAESPRVGIGLVVQDSVANSSGARHATPRHTTPCTSRCPSPFLAIANRRQSTSNIDFACPARRGQGGGYAPSRLRASLQPIAERTIQFLAR